MCFMCFIPRAKQIYAKPLTISEITFKIKAMSTWALFKILITSAVIFKQKFLHKNKIVQYLQNYTYQDVNQDHFRKPLQASTNAMKNNYPKIVHTFFTGSSIFSYFLCLNCYNFRTALTKSIKLHFLEITLL